MICKGLKEALGGFAVLRKIPLHREHEVSVDRRIGALRHQVAADTAVKAEILVEDVIGAQLQCQGVVFHEHLRQGSVTNNRVGIGREQGRFLPEVHICIYIKKELQRQVLGEVRIQFIVPIGGIVGRLDG